MKFAFVCCWKNALFLRSTKWFFELIFLPCLKFDLIKEKSEFFTLATRSPYVDNKNSVTYNVAENSTLR